MKKNVLIGILVASVLFLFANQRKKIAENSSLLNTRWILTELYEIPVVQAADTAFIIFNEDYKISGNLGCNLFFGNFSFGKTRMKIDFLGSTRRLCLNMDVEDRFSKALRDNIKTYHIEKNTLYLHNKDRVVCKFEGN
ncbi:MAG: META domain-containing protein [Lentimicrobiaceae bacterium]|nr:META domain-containing protein [Lentimicrobiaceae bacterium]